MKARVDAAQRSPPLRHLRCWTALLGGVAAQAHQPGGDGGPAERGCGTVARGGLYVGASGEVGCKRARTIARDSALARRGFRLWRCTGFGEGFGHCHGKERWRGSIVHWAVND